MDIVRLLLGGTRAAYGSEAVADPNRVARDSSELPRGQRARPLLQPSRLAARARPVHPHGGAAGCEERPGGCYVMCRHGRDASVSGLGTPVPALVAVAQAISAFAAHQAGGNADGDGNRQMVQRRQGLRVHHPDDRSKDLFVHHSGIIGRRVSLAGARAPRSATTPSAATRARRPSTSRSYSPSGWARAPLPPPPPPPVPPGEAQPRAGRLGRLVGHDWKRGGLSGRARGQGRGSPDPGCSPQ